MTRLLCDLLSNKSKFVLLFLIERLKNHVSNNTGSFKLAPPCKKNIPSLLTGYFDRSLSVLLDSADVVGGTS
jgi:hypothetical protein